MMQSERPLVITCAKLVVLVMVFCVLPEYQGMSLSGDRWSFGFPFQSFILQVGWQTRFRVAWGLGSNALVWAIGMYCLSVLQRRFSGFRDRELQMTQRIAAATLALVSMNTEGFAQGVLLFAMCFGMRHAAVIILFLFFVLLPCLLGCLLFGLLRHGRIRNSLAALLATLLSLVALLTSWCWRHGGPSTLIAMWQG